MKKIRVNIISESETSVQGHGVHTAYIEMVDALRKYTDAEVTTGQTDRRVKSDVIHLHTIGPRVWPKLFQKGSKLVISAHIVPDSFVGSLVLAKYWRFVAVWYMRWFYNRADLVLAVSEEAKNDLLKLGITVPIEVFHNFIDAAKYTKPTISRETIRHDLGIPDDAFVVIGAGQVQPRKRVDCFFTAALALPSVHFVWVGGVPFGKIAADSAHMKKMMTEASNNVHFTGIVPLTDMVSYYHAADLFWLPSEQETFGLVVVEAAATGLPVLLRDIPDYDDTFADDALYAKDDEDFIAKIKMLQENFSERAAWSNHAGAIAERFDSKQAAQKLIELYRRLVA